MVNVDYECGGDDDDDDDDDDKCNDGGDWTHGTC